MQLAEENKSFKLSKLTSFTASHQSSSSAKPAFTYSPLLKEQHSRRRRRLEFNKKCHFFKGMLTKDYEI